MKKFVILASFCMITMILTSSSHAATSDLVGKSRTYTYTRQGDYTTYDGSKSDSFTTTSEVSLKFADQLDDGKLQYERTETSSDQVIALYTKGGYQINTVPLSSTSVQYGLLTFSVYNYSQSYNGIFLVVNDTSSYIDLVGSYFNENPNITIIDKTATQISYVSDYMRTYRNLLPVFVENNTVHEVIKENMAYDTDGMLQSYSRTKTIEFGDITIIKETYELRSGFSRTINNTLTSPIFYAISAMILAAIGIFVWFKRFR